MNISLFTRQGKITLTITPKEKTSDRLVVFFIVEDTGIGIPNEKQEQIFRAFTQADSSTPRQYGGTVLWLTISRRIVELMGGGLGVKSNH